MTETTLYCYVHPNRETSLRCNNCNRPICASCAIRTPTGYRCRECVRGQQKVFDTALWQDYVLGFVVAGALSALASFLATLVGGFGFFMLLIMSIAASTAGIIIAEGARLVTRRRRSRPLFLTVAAGMILGALPVIGFQVLNLNVWGLIAQALYLVIAVPVMYSRLSGIQFFR
ncbi:MAG TPA: hypothetical protein VIU39_07125 [Anaerolineales bacterium]